MGVQNMTTLRMKTVNTFVHEVPESRIWNLACIGSIRSSNYHMLENVSHDPFQDHDSDFGMLILLYVA